MITALLVAGYLVGIYVIGYPLIAVIDYMVGTKPEKRWAAITWPLVLVFFFIVAPTWIVMHFDKKPR